MIASLPWRLFRHPPRQRDSALHSHARRLAAALSAGLVAFVVLAPGSSRAMPVGPTVFCEAYPDVPACQGVVPSCVLCHTTPPARNAFGLQLETALLPGVPRPLDATKFAEALPDALIAIEAEDADVDGHSNLDELLFGSIPADPNSVPADMSCQLPEDGSWSYNTCDFDITYTYRKVMLDFCGHSPARVDINQVLDAPDPVARIHEALEACLDSEYWLGKDGVLWNLANRKIKPTASLKAGVDAGDIPLGDYYDDYNLFVYSQSDDRDARELLTATFFVDRTDATTPAYSVRPLDNEIDPANAAGQAIEPAQRAGLLTTRWTLVSFTMFTPIPRTTAAQMYRAFLGYDIARMEGLQPVVGEPADYDLKGVTAPECAACHSTLDPLSYPFTRYNGLSFDIDATVGGIFLFPTTYNENRLGFFADEEGPLIAEAPEAGILFGQPVANLVEWGQVAANSDAFARATVLDYWQLLFGEPPRPDESEQFTALWQAFRNENGYSVERMLHELIDTEAYRVP